MSFVAWIALSALAALTGLLVHRVRLLERNVITLIEHMTCQARHATDMFTTMACELHELRSVAPAPTPTELEAIPAPTESKSELDPDDEPTLHVSSSSPRKSASELDVAQVIAARQEAQQKRREVVDPIGERIRSFREMAKNATKDFAERIRRVVNTAVVVNLTEDEETQRRALAERGLTKTYTFDTWNSYDHGGTAHGKFRVDFAFVSYVRVNTDTVIGFAVNAYGEPDRLVAAWAKVEYDPVKRVVYFDVHEEITFAVDEAWIKRTLDAMAEEAL